MMYHLMKLTIPDLQVVFGAGPESVRPLELHEGDMQQQDGSLTGSTTRSLQHRACVCIPGWEVKHDWYRRL